MNAIGGYFELELPKGEEYHQGANRLNTGRNALEYILRANNYKKIFLPYFSCKVLLQPIQRLGIDYEFYQVSENLEAKFDFNKVGPSSAFLYINYFGLKSNYIGAIRNNCSNLIVDNAQAFFEMPIHNTDTIYTARKFFGVPDGAYLYNRKAAEIEVGESFSYQRFEQLLRRIDRGAEDGYSYFVANENALTDLPLGQMSQLTKKILQSIDYSSVALIRRRNYQYLHRSLAQKNRLQLDLNEVNVPMIYPFLGNDAKLREKLIEHKIYVARYWPNVLEWCKKGSVEYELADALISLPIDQRLDIKDLDEVLKLTLA